MRDDAAPCLADSMFSTVGVEGARAKLVAPSEEPTDSAEEVAARVIEGADLISISRDRLGRYTPEFGRVQWRKVSPSLADAERLRRGVLLCRHTRSRTRVVITWLLLAATWTVTLWVPDGDLLRWVYGLLMFVLGVDMADAWHEHEAMSERVGKAWSAKFDKSEPNLIE